MKIDRFSMKNYRSIVKKQNIDLKDLSIIIGPNNEGKSNILNAITSALLILTEYEFYYQRYRHRRRPTRKVYHMGRINDPRSFYDWTRDFPVGRQSQEPNGKTVFEIVFNFTSEELEGLNKMLGLSLNSEIIFTLLLGKNSIDINIDYPANRRIKLNTRKIKILNYLSQHIAIEYIDSLRTAQRTTTLIDSLIERDMVQLGRNNTEYERLFRRLEKLQEPALKKISKEVSNSIKQFLPNVKEVEVTSVDRIRRIMHESCEVKVDDGNKTLLELKGDGIKSLVAISLMHHLAKQRHTGQDIVFAIEEPEVHLHPDSIHKLKEVLEEISRSYQVIITTHSPIFVDRAHLEKNILVTKNDIKTVTNISEIRAELGVRVSDNLKSATLVILTEGVEDVQILKSWLFKMSHKVKDAYEKGLFVFETMGGCNNLSYQVSLHRNLICNVLVYLDADTEGKKAYQEAKKASLLTPKDVFLTSTRSVHDTEIEDLVKASIYKKGIKNRYGVELQGSVFRNNRNKWSIRVKETFIDQGKPWDDEIEADVKKIVCRAVEEAGLSSLKLPNAGSVRSKKKRIEDELNL